MAINFDRYSPRRQNDPNVMIAASVGAYVLGTAIFLGSVFFAASQDQGDKTVSTPTTSQKIETPSEQPKSLENN